MADLRKLKINRATFKAAITRIKTWVEDPATVADLATVEVKTAKLKSIWADYGALWGSVIDLVADDEALAEHQADFEAEEIKVEELQVKLAQLVKAMAVPVPIPAARHASPNGSTVSYVGSAIKLPKLDFDGFTGNYKDWKSFEDIFIAIVHNNPTLSDVTKLQYLLSKLKGEPKSLLNALQITGDNYDIAWSILRNRYENKRVILFEHVKSLFSLPSVHADSSSELKKLMDATIHEIRALEVMGYKLEDNEFADLLITFTFMQKLDAKTCELWNMASEAKIVPKWDLLLKFVEKRCFDLESREPNLPAIGLGKVKKSSFHAEASGKKKCILCPNDTHGLYKCSMYDRMAVAERKATVKRYNLCFICLQSGHRSSACTFKYKCRTCGKGHHTSLHEEKSAPGIPQLSAHVKEAGDRSSMALLATAIVRVKDCNSRYVNCRVLLDQGSQVNCVSEECVMKLGLKRQHSNITLSGLGENSIQNVKGEVNLFMQSMFNNFTLNANALVLPKVTGFQPYTSVEVSWRWNHLVHLPLADPNYFKPGKVDILLGASQVAAILREGIRKGHELAPVAQDTEFGWVLFGEVASQHPVVRASHHLTVLHANSALEEQLKKFWELEEVPVDPNANFTDEERKCEEHFATTHSRDLSGRFVVRYPFNDSIHDLGQSRNIAFRRLMQIERKLEKVPNKKVEYAKFMTEYKGLNHMQDFSFVKNTGRNYLPHHFVEKESTTTKLRVVFDASAHTDNGRSFNSTQMVGPTLQHNIVDTYIRWRFHIVPLVADVAKMFRQINIHPEDRKYQHILWREKSEGPILDYELTTVTYGTASAPYLATKCIQQLAIDEACRFPTGSIVALEDAFMDDVVTGGRTVAEVAQIQDELIGLYNAGGFPLRKFLSSAPGLLERIEPSLRATDTENIFDSKEAYKALGISWDVQLDEFYFKFIDLPSRKLITKRTLSSDIARTFDPLGWLAPFSITPKILLQKLWTFKLDWDEAVPDCITQEWKQLKEQMNLVTNVRLSRCVLSPNYGKFELHGFGDASELAYAAAIYVVSIDVNGKRQSSLLVAKTKVAPIKTISVPCLELCAALLVTKLLKNVISALKTKRADTQYNFTVRAWSDSTTVLYWLQSHSRRWTTFIANRVGKIQMLLPDISWGHVRSEENPADCASRGLTFEELTNFQLWWKGPTWLLEEVGVLDIPEPPPEIIALHERKQKVILTVVHSDSILTRYSTFDKLISVTGFMLRFVNNCKAKKAGITIREKFLTAEERKAASLVLIKQVQLSAYANEIKMLMSQKPINSSLKAFLPFLDEQGILRVGGRLEKAFHLPETARHPIILPNGVLSNLIIFDYHLKNLHSGLTLTLASVRQRYWIFGARKAITACIKKCAVCVKYRAAAQQPPMGNLPVPRVNPSAAFLHTGTDFAGPVLVRTWSGRGRKSVKAYICVFICFSTKAIHLELVSELSTAAFLAALDRFISLRGKPNHIYSDNGTNYVGAERELRVFYDTQEAMEKVGERLAKDSIGWSFSPPAGPHFGGIWESAVKSTKFHLKRVLGSSSFTVEEMMTILAKISACLNSRPLCPMSSHADDLEAITPGHFLIGRPLNAVPYGDVKLLKWNSMDRWQKVQQVTQLFWDRWSLEYLSELQKRAKWNKDEPNLKVGDVVVIKEDNIPPAKWKLGRITQVFPGTDGKVRVVNLRTENGELKRPAVKLCLLPTQE